MKLQIWDGSSLDYRFQCGKPSPYRGTSGYVICYDTTDPDYTDEVLRWLCQIERFGGDNSFVILVGTKSDLPPAVDPAAVREFADSHNLPHMLFSAKTGAEVDKFTEMIAMTAWRNIYEADLFLDEFKSPEGPNKPGGSGSK